MGCFCQLNFRPIRLFFLWGPASQKLKLTITKVTLSTEINSLMQPSPYTFLYTRTTSDSFDEIGLLYNGVMVNHYSLVSFLGSLHNQDLIIEQVREYSPTILPVLPDQEKVLRSVALFWERVRQRVIERESEIERKREREIGEREMKWTEEVHFPCHMPAAHPAESRASWPLRFYRCRNVSGACAI